MAAKHTESPCSRRVNDRCVCGSRTKYHHGHDARATATRTAEASACIPVAAYLGIAEKAMAAGRLPEAQSAYLAVLDRDATSFDALLGMAALAEGAGDDAASQHYHSRLAQAHPRNPRALFALGNFFAKRFDFDRARSSYRQA